VIRTCLQLSVRDLQLDVEVCGDPAGEPVLLLHGFPQCRGAWDQVVPVLAAAGMRTAAPDQRGYSPRARPVGAAAYRLPLLAADSLGVLDALGLDRAHMVGHDWGAVVAWYLAARHPERVHTLTAISFPHLDAYWQALRTDPEQRRRSRYLPFFMSPESTAALLADDAAGLRALFGDAVAPEQVARYLALHTAPGALDATLNWYRSGSLLDDAEPLGPVRVPTTFVSSDGDLVASPAAVHGTAEQVTASYRLAMLPGVSHWQPEQAAELVAAEILARAGH